MKKISLTAVILLSIAIFCSCKNKNVAREYNSKSDCQNSVFLGEKIPLHDNIINISSCCISNGDIYYSFPTEKITEKIRVAENDSDFIDVPMNFEYSIIKDCVLAEDGVYVLFKDANGDNLIALISNKGEVIKSAKCGYEDSIFSTESGLYLISVDPEDKCVLSEYNKNLELIKTETITQKICSEDEIISEFKIDKDNNGYAMVAYDIKNLNEDTVDCKFKIVSVDLQSFAVKKELNLNAPYDISSFWITDSSIDVSYKDGDNSFIVSFDKSNGECIGETSTFSSQKVYNGAYLSDSCLYDYNNNLIYEPEDDKEEVCYYGVYGSKKLIRSFERDNQINICRNKMSGTLTNEYIVKIPDYYIPGNKLSVYKNKIAFSAYEPEADENFLVIYDTVQETVLIEKNDSYIKDLEIVSDNNIVVINSVNDKSCIKWFDCSKQDFSTDDNSVDSEGVSLCRDNNDLVTLLGYSKNALSVYKLGEDGKFSLYDNIALEYDKDDLYLKNGYGEIDFFIVSSNEIYEYTKENCKSAINMASLNSICEISGIVPVNKDNCIVYGMDYNSYKAQLFDTKRIDKSEREIIKVAVEDNVSPYVYDKISNFNKDHKQYLLKTEISDDVYDLPDIYIYGEDIDVSQYINNSMFYNLNSLIDDSNGAYLSIASAKEKEEKDIFRVIPSFSLMSFGHEQNNLHNELTQDDIVEKLIKYKLNEYIDYKSCNCNFQTQDFYDKLKALRLNSQDISFSVYDSVEELMKVKNKIGDYENVLIPDYYISVFKSDNSKFALEFVSGFLNDNYQNEAMSRHYGNLPVKKSFYYNYSKDNTILENECDNLINIMDNIYTCTEYKKDIYNILSEEISNYLGSDKSEEQTAVNIEQRVNLYLKERK